MTSQKDCESSTKILNLKANDMILLTSQTNKLVGLSQGFIKSISNDGNKFTLLLDKDLNERSENTNMLKGLFRIDKINFRSAITLNYTNLARLMSDGTNCARLRSLIIDKAKPTFLKVLPKDYVLKNKQIFKKLNTSQQQSVIKVEFSG